MLPLMQSAPGTCSPSSLILTRFLLECKAGPQPCACSCIQSVGVFACWVPGMTPGVGGVPVRTATSHPHGAGIPLGDEVVVLTKEQSNLPQAILRLHRACI